MIKKTIIIAALTLITCAAYATDKMTPEQQQAMMQQQMKMMTPMFGEMMKIMMETQFQILSRPDTADKLASFTRNYYRALLKKGFTKEQALDIVMRAGFPAAPMMGQ